MLKCRSITYRGCERGSFAQPETRLCLCTHLKRVLVLLSRRVDGLLRYKVVKLSSQLEGKKLGWGTREAPDGFSFMPGRKPGYHGIPGERSMPTEFEFMKPQGRAPDQVLDGPPSRRHGSTLINLVRALRPADWVKNGFVFPVLIFSGKLTDWGALRAVLLAALIFCVVSSAMYVLNDVADAPEDRRHPVKRLRPVAAGLISPQFAVFCGVALAVGGLAAAWRLDRGFFVAVAAYVVITVAYSLAFKHVMLVDVFVVANGFVIRVVAGATVIHRQPSAWLIVCTTFLALFLALGKRRHELVALGDRASEHRAHLSLYSPYFLDQLIGIVTACTVMSYALYTLSNDVAQEFPGRRLELTVPCVLFGIFRYLYLVHQRAEGGNPARLLFTDRVLFSVVALWALTAALIIYL
jgi:4-hydroxybenzoate polyprenyltransferase